MVVLHLVKCLLMFVSTGRSGRENGGALKISTSKYVLIIFV